MDARRLSVEEVKVGHGTVKSSEISYWHQATKLPWEDKSNLMLITVD